MDWFDLLAVQGTLKSLLQNHNLKASILNAQPSLQHLLDRQKSESWWCQVAEEMWRPGNPQAWGAGTIRGNAGWSCPLWPSTIVTICLSFMTGGPSKEHGTNKPPPTGRIREKSKGDTACPTTSQNPPRWRPSWLSNACTARKDPQSKWLTTWKLTPSPWNPIPLLAWQRSPPGFPRPPVLHPGATPQ